MSNFFEVEAPRDDHPAGFSPRGRRLRVIGAIFRAEKETLPSKWEVLPRVATGFKFGNIGYLMSYTPCYRSHTPHYVLAHHPLEPTVIQLFRY